MCYNKRVISGCSEVGIAPGLGPGDRAFESRHSDQVPNKHDHFDTKRYGNDRALPDYM